MTALVTGGAGFIGSHLVEALLRRNIAVRVLDALDPVVHPSGRPHYLPDDVPLLEGDIRDERLLAKALEGVDVVFHQAACQGFMPNFSVFFDVNAVGTALIYELIVRKHLPVRKVIVASSQAVYGEGKYRCPTCETTKYPSSRPEERLQRREWDIPCPTCGSPLDWQLTDESVVKPFTQYALSKHTQETIALNFGRRYGIPSVALRYSITQGPRQSFTNAYSGILRIFSLRYLSGRAPVIYEDGLMQRDYVHIEDVVAANLAVLDSDAANYEAFNVGSGRPTTQIQYATKLAEHLQIEPYYEIPGEYRFGDVRHIVSDVSKLERIGWRVTKPLDDIVADYLSWVAEQPNLQDYFETAEHAMKAAGAVRKAFEA
jgi:dTDP-L-rhamnose 4-epimerase